jgi:hypothetical protein
MCLRGFLKISQPTSMQVFFFQSALEQCCGSFTFGLPGFESDLVWGLVPVTDSLPFFQHYYDTKIFII